MLICAVDESDGIRVVRSEPSRCVDAAGKKQVRFAVWDSAGNGAFTQPIHLK